MLLLSGQITIHSINIYIFGSDLNHKSAQISFNVLGYQQKVGYADTNSIGQHTFPLGGSSTQKYIQHPLQCSPHTYPPFQILASFGIIVPK